MFLFDPNHWSQIQNEPFFAMIFRISLLSTIFWILFYLLKKALLKMGANALKHYDSDSIQGGEAEKRIKTLSKLSQQILRIVLLCLWGTLMLSEFKIDIAPLLASAGIIGLAVGFGAQNLVKDVISGFFIIIENQLRVGDVAQINGTGGVVEAINLRTLILRDGAGTVHIFPNGNISTLANMTHSWSGHLFEVGVGYHENLDFILNLFRETLDELKATQDVVLEIPEIFGLDRIENSSLIIKGRIKTKPGQHWGMGRLFLKMLKERFDHEGIQRPNPHQFVFLKNTDHPLPSVKEAP